MLKAEMDARTAVPREELRIARGQVESAEAERERQLVYLQQRAGKRLMQADLARGWSAWLDAFLERRRKQRLLRGAASRLARPALAACVAVWRAQWIVTERARAAKRESAAQREKERNQAKHEGWTSELQDELAQVKLDARDSQAELEKTLAVKAEAERERRTEHIQEMAVRRLGTRDLGRGWQAWLDEFLERRRKQRLLAAAAGRLAKPALTAALTQP